MKRLFAEYFDWLMDCWKNATLLEFLALYLAVVIIGYFISRMSALKGNVYR